MSTKRYFLPSEWHRQRFVLLAWPDAATDWKDYLSDIEQTMTAIVDAITRREDVVVVARSAERVRQRLGAQLDASQLRRVTAVDCALDDTWARDFGGLTLVADEGGEAQVLDFCFNGWGEKYPAENDNGVTRRLHAMGLLAGTLVDNSDFVLEGGSIESDGRGTLFTTTACLLAPHRNQPLSQDDIEEQLLRRLHAERIVWLHHGTLMGDDTDGHIDTIVRICPDDTLLYVKAAVDDAQHDDLAAMEEELRALTTLDGRPYRLLPLPLPRPIYDDGERLPATYANFFVVNGAVIVPTYGQKDLDDEACRTIGTAFPDRDIVAIDATTIVRQRGSIHCLTMQYPYIGDN